MRIILFLIGTLLLGSGSAFAQTFHLLIGTYTQNGSKGIYVYRFNAATGTAEWVSNTDSLDNPSFLAVSPDRKYVYAVNETGGDQPGGVTALSFDKGSGKLSVLNRQPSGGDHPCYVTITRDGKWVIAGNYT
ncbi:MAG TPA: beta-propeller fold lactonase family protein, partial [Chitinophagaceae bacterium]|nr:beta-propeller fold lactonase family protein [Chitinophagaceae bacterium]